MVDIMKEIKVLTNSYNKTEMKNKISLLNFFKTIRFEIHTYICAIFFVYHILNNTYLHESWLKSASTINKFIPLFINKTNTTKQTKIAQDNLSQYDNE